MAHDLRFDGEPVPFPPRGRTGLFGSVRGGATFCILAGAGALAVAFGSEWFEGLVPCALCLWERWPYRVIIVLGALALALPRRLGRAALTLSLLAMLAVAALSFVHVGVEQHWWPSPSPECAAPRFAGGSLAERLAAMPARPAKPCDEPAFLIPAVPVSMAALGMLYALAVAAGIALFLRQTRRSP